jgi:hypothetical protein
MDTRTQLIDLYNSLGEFAPTDRAPQQLMDVFNVLLGEAKTAKGDHGIIAAIKVVPPHEMGQSINCGGLRALAQQLISALESD